MMGQSSPPAANPNSDAMKTLGDLLGVVSDPAAYNERLTSLRAATKEAQEATEAANTAKAQAEAARRDLAAESAKLEADRNAFSHHERTKQAEFRDMETALASKTDALAARERKLDADTAAAVKKTDEAARDIDARSAKLAADVAAHIKSAVEREKEIKKASEVADRLRGQTDLIRKQQADAKAAQMAADSASKALLTTIEKILTVQK